MTDYLPKFQPGEATTFQAGGDVTGGQLVAVTTAGLVVPTTGPTHAVAGVAAHDAKTGRKVGVYGPGVHELVAGVDVTAGQLVEAATGGKVGPHTIGAADLNAIGLALTSATAGQPVRVRVA